MQCNRTLSALVAFLSFLAPAGAVTSSAKPYVVYVARVQDDGALADETSLRCDLTQSCEVRLPPPGAGLESMLVRLFAEDSGGISLFPILQDADGRLAFGRRRDVAWGPQRSVNVTVPVRPMGRSEDSDGMSAFGVTIREDLPPVATLLIAVKELERPQGIATQ
jgi:hypothetical protein